MPTTGSGKILKTRLREMFTSPPAGRHPALCPAAGAGGAAGAAAIAVPAAAAAAAPAVGGPITLPYGELLAAVRAATPPRLPASEMYELGAAVAPGFAALLVLEAAGDVASQVSTLVELADV